MTVSNAASLVRFISLPRNVLFRQRNYPFARQLRGIVYRRLDRLSGNRRVASHDFLRIQSVREVVEDRGHQDSGPGDAGPSVADFRINGNVISPIYRRYPLNGLDVLDLAPDTISPRSSESVVQTITASSIDPKVLWRVGMQLRQGGD